MEAALTGQLKCGASLSRRYADAPVNAAAVKAVLQDACGERPFEGGEPEAGEMRAEAVLLAVDVAGRQDFGTHPELIEQPPASRAARAPGIEIGASGKRRRERHFAHRLPPGFRGNACADTGRRVRRAFEFGAGEYFDLET